MISIGLCGIATYLLFGFLGFGAYVLVVSKRGIRPTTLFVLPPLFGCAGVVLALTHCLSWRLAIPQASIAVLAAMGIPSLAAVVLARRELARALRRSMRSLRWMVWVSTALLMGGLLLWSASRDGRLNSPYRLGIDQVGYITTASVLMDGATLDTIESRLLADTVSRNRAEAMQRIKSAVNYTNQLAAVFLFGAVRWGFSLLLVFLTTVLRLPHVAISVYPLLAMALSLLHGLVFLFCRSRLRSAGFAPCLAIASSVSLNANMLNVAFDGQLGQAFGLPFFFAWWWQFTHGFSDLTAARLSPARRLVRKSWTSWAIAVLAAVTLLPTYGEFVIVLFILAALTLLADTTVNVVRGRSCCLWRYQLLALCFGIALAMLGGFGGMWLHNVALTRFGDLPQAGWMQPRWAGLLEILGFSDIYTLHVYELVPQAYRDMEFHRPANAILLVAVAWGIVRNRALCLSSWAVLPVFVMLVYYKTRFIEGIHNYQYMKSYTMTGPVLFLLFAGCILSIFAVERKAAAFRERLGVPAGWRRLVAAGVLLVPAFVGLMALRRFHVQGHFLSLDDLATQSAPAARDVLARHVIFTPGTTPYSIGNDSLAFQCPFHWLRNRYPQEVTPYRDWPVAIYLGGETTPGVRDLRDATPPPLIGTDRFLVCETGLRVSDLLDDEDRTVDWSRLAAVVEEMCVANPR